ncbi:MAG: FAS1-like dehydratase domain-containing protein [Bdellovibrionota bacterium]
MIPKSQVGKKVGPYRETITPQRIDAFRAAVGAGAYSAVPPTYLTIFRRGEFDLMKELRVQLSSVLHADQDYLYEHELGAGDAISYETTLANVIDKNGPSGSMQFVTFETVVTKAGARAAVGRTTIVIKQR